jgi:hypothetical protein
MLFDLPTLSADIKFSSADSPRGSSGNLPALPEQPEDADASLASEPSSASVRKRSKGLAVFRDVGGTISGRSCCVSADGRKLLCWPYGLAEEYDLRQMCQLMDTLVRTEERKKALGLTSSDSDRDSDSDSDVEDSNSNEK